MEHKNFIGIDMGKSTFHCCLYKGNTKGRDFECTNDRKGLEDMEKKLGLDLQGALFCVEHTGIYNNHFLGWMHEKKHAVWLENPAAIKKSMGLQRGKNDRIDAERIAQYAARFQDKCRLWEPERKVITQLKKLSRLRDRLIGAKTQLTVPLNEEKKFGDAEIQKQITAACAGTLKSLGEDIKKVEREIEKVISSDDHMRQVFNIAKSVPGVGTVNAVALIVATNEFKDITTAKACACYAGVAPFEHSSGTSVRKRCRVSPIAHKGLKKLLHMAALSVIRLKGELQDYYNRQVEAGKHKMLVLNAIRNKILKRIFACVTAMRPYEENYVYLAAA